MLSRALCCALTGVLVAAAGGCVGEVAQEPRGASAGSPGADPGESPPSSAPGSPPAAGGSAGGPAGACTEDAIAPRIWRLSDEQYRKAVTDLLPSVTVPEISTPGRSRAEFINDAELYPVSGALAVDLRTSATAVAKAAVADLDARLACPAGQAQRECAAAFVDRLVTRAVRRPLEPAEHDAYAKLFGFGADKSVADGVRLSIEALLQSPSFLYRTELGAGGDAHGAGSSVALGPYELASALSFFFLDSIPDDALWRAAEDGSIARPDGYAREVTRLLGLPRARANLGRIFLKWVGLGDGVTTELASEDYPDYDQPLRQALTDEAERFFGNALAAGSSLSDLFTTRRSFVDKRLATLYGVAYPGAAGAATPSPDPAGFVAVDLPAAERVGMLTLGGFIVSKSRGEMSVHRGKWVREELLCGTIPDPPANINVDAARGLNLTPRQAAEMRMKDGTCGACHRLMDGIGVTFGHYDGIARYQAKDAVGPIDASGELELSDVDGKVKDVVEVAQRLATSQQTRLCIETRMLAYALGHESEEGGVDECRARQLDQQVGGGSGRLIDLMGAIARMPDFRIRTGGQ